MINLKNVLPILKNTLPKASEEQLIDAIKKFEKAHPEYNDTQFLAAMQTYMKQKQPVSQPQQPPFQNLLGQLPQGVK